MKRFSNILMIADEGLDWSAALNRAVTLARNNQALLTLCSTVDSIPSETQLGIAAITPAELLEIAVTEKQEWLENVIDSVADNGITLKAKVLVGRPFIEIIRQVLGNDYDLVIKCAEATGDLRGMLFGSTDMHLMRKCPCPVWIVKPTEHHKYHRILAAVDKVPEEPAKDVLNRQIVEMSTSLALAESSELHIVHAWNLLGEDFFRSPRSSILESEVDATVAEEASNRKRWLEDLVKRYGTMPDKDAVDFLDPHLHVIQGHAKQVVAAQACELAVDLVVMGTVARTGLPGFFMGNTAESILNQIDCSVLTVKPPGFISPVALKT